MDLCDLPSEVLNRIVTDLDTDSLFTTRLVNQRLRAISLTCEGISKLKKITKSDLKFFHSNQSVIHSLDLSDCTASSADLKSLILICVCITELNVVNSLLVYPDLLAVLPHLNKLEALSFTLSGFETIKRSKSCEPNLNSSIKKLYIETCPGLWPLGLIVKLTNMCKAIEDLRVNLIGWEPNEDKPYGPPTLLRERWKTLHTFICWCNLTSSSMYRSLIQMIFQDSPLPRQKLIAWRNQQNKCYIYDHGNLNDHIPHDGAKGVNATLMKDFQCITFTDEAFFLSTSTPRRSLSLSSFGGVLTEIHVPTITTYLSPTLVELDLTECHGVYPHSTRIDVFTSSPSLKVMALPLCFYLIHKLYCPEEYSFFYEGQCSCSQVRESFSRSLHTLRLKKLFLKANCQRATIHVLQCVGCLSQLTSENLTSLHAMEHLEELVLEGVKLRDSAYDALWNSNLHTVKLCLEKGSKYSGLQTFVRRCSKVRSFKLKAPDILINTTFIWQALDEGKNFKRLCLGSNQRITFDMSTNVLPEFFQKILERIDVIHMHSPHIRHYDSVMICTHIKNCLGHTNSSLADKVYFRWPEHSREADLNPSLPARCLCLTETYIGLAKPVWWYLDK